MKNLSLKEKLKQHKKRIKGMEPGESYNTILMFSVIAMGFAYDRQLDTMLGISGLVFLSIFVYMICWSIDCFIYAIRKKKYDKTKLPSESKGDSK